MEPSEKETIRREIDRARDGLSADIDALDHQIRQQLNFRTIAAENAPQIIGAGAALGFLVGFGFPRPLRKLIKFGLPLAMIALKAKQKYDERNAINPS